MGPWDSIESGGADGTTIWGQDLGVDKSNDGSVGGFPSSDGLADCGNCGYVYRVKRVGVPPDG